MHSSLPLRQLFLFTAASIIAHPARAITPKPVVETLEHLAQLAGHAPGRSAAETLENAFRAQGHVALEAAQRGGPDLIEAAAHHGDEVLGVARRVPEAARYVCAQPEQALSLVSRFGDDALRIVVRAPGMAEETAQHFGRAGLGALKDAAPADIVRLNGYAARADSIATRTALLDTWKRRGTSVLNELDKRKALILTAGLTLGIIDVSEGISRAITDLPRNAPEVLNNLTTPLGEGGKIALICIALGLSLAFILRVRNSERSRKPASR